MIRHGLSVRRCPMRSHAFTSQVSNIKSSPSRLSYEWPNLMMNLDILSRGYAAHASKMKRKQISPMVTSIQRLEQHVQLLQQKYRDHVKQEALSSELPSVEITEEMQDEAYAALMAPPDDLTRLLPPPKTIATLLPDRVKERINGASLSLIADDSDSAPPWPVILKEISGNGGFKDLEIKEINKTLFLIPTEERTELTDEILGMIKTSGVAMNTFTYDLLMLAHADRGNVERVQDLFVELKSKGLPLSQRVFGHLMKAYSKTTDVPGASAAFTEMQAAGIKPNRIVYTSLIKTCINREELDTAWAIFELIKYRSVETAPDLSTYSLMIHACARRGEAERALDLFRHLKDDRGLEPDATIYNALIHACAVRKDYFLDAWKYAIEMRNKGMTVGLWTLNLLLQACGKSGDLTRARLLVRLMMSSGSPEFQPDERSFQHLFRAYANFVETASAKVVPQDPFFLSPGKEGTNTQLSQNELERLPFLKSSVLNTRRHILQEAKSLLEYLKKEKPQFVSTRILNAYMDLCMNKHAGLELKRVYTREFASVKPAVSDHIHDEYHPWPQSLNEVPKSASESAIITKPKRNIFTFEIALEYAKSAKANKLAQQVWADRVSYCRTAEYLQLLPSIRRRLDFAAERLMLQILAKNGKLNEAIDRLRILQDEYEWTKSDLKILYDAAIKEEDMNAIKTLREVLGLSRLSDEPLM